MQEATDPWPEAPWVSVLIDARLGTVRELAYSLRSVELQFWPRTEVCVLYDLEKDRRFEECLQEFIIKYPYTHPHTISGHVGSRDSESSYTTCVKAAGGLNWNLGTGWPRFSFPGTAKLEEAA